MQTATPCPFQLAGEQTKQSFPSIQPPVATSMVFTSPPDFEYSNGFTLSRNNRANEPLTFTGSLWMERPWPQCPPKPYPMTVTGVPVYQPKIGGKLSPRSPLRSETPTKTPTCMYPSPTHRACGTNLSPLINSNKKKGFWVS